MNKKEKLVYIGQILKTARINANLSQEELGEKIGKSYATVSRWESGNREMNVNDLIDYLDACKLTVEEKEDIIIRITFAGNQKALRKLGIK